MNIQKNVIVSMVGKANVGKSTLTNRLVGKKVAIVSPKPQTTRTRITGVANRDGCQFVFMDTPGYHKPRSRLGDFMVKVTTDTVAEVDCAALVVEPDPTVHPAEEALLDAIRRGKVPAVLVINKMDTVRREQLLPVIAAYSARHSFAAVVPVSGKTGENLEILLEELEKFALEGPQLFPDDMVSDQPERQVVAEIIREKLLTLLDREVPHGIAVELIKMEREANGVVSVSATIYCEKKSHKGIIIGGGGAMLKRTGQLARADIEALVGGKVYLELWVKVKEGWRNNTYQMRNFGYDGDNA